MELEVTGRTGDGFRSEKRKPGAGVRSLFSPWLNVDALPTLPKYRSCVTPGATR
jgi:hypothetical protein